MTQYKTQRQFVFHIVQQLRYYCENNHNHTNGIINLIYNHTSHDEKLHKFLLSYQGTGDPKYNNLWDETKWPSLLDELAYNKMNTNYIDSLNEFVQFVGKYGKFLSNGKETKVNNGLDTTQRTFGHKDCQNTAIVGMEKMMK